MATRQPSEDNDCWHSEINKLKSGGVVSETDKEEEFASSAEELDKLLDSEEFGLSDKEDELETDDDDSLAESASDEEDEPASSAGKLDEPAEEELSATPVPPPPKPG